jgi:hypothetical protein
MDNQPNPSSKVPPFLPPDPSINPGKIGRQGHVSQRGLLSLMTMVISSFTLLFMMAGWLKVTWDIFNLGLLNVHGLLAKGITLALTFLFGWIMGILSIRVFSNLILPIIIKIMAWVVLAGISVLYIAIIQRLYKQGYDLPHFLAYLLMMGAGLVVLVGLHLILDGHDLRPYAIPLLIIAMGQLFVIVFRYVFTTDAKEAFLIYDIIFFAIMTTVSALMLAHRGMLNPLRHLITRFFDQNSHTLRPET